MESTKSVKLGLAKSGNLGLTKSVGFWTKWAVNIIMPLIILLLPTSEQFTSTVKLFLGITLFSIILIATENLANPIIGLALPFVYIEVLDIPAAVVLRPWTMEIPWMMISALLITKVLQKSGVMKRIAYKSMLLLGGSFRGIIYGMPIAGIIVSLIIADPNPRIMIFFSLAVGICQAMNLKLGGKTSSAIGLSALMAAMSPALITYTGSMNNIITFGIALEGGVPTPSWMEYVIHMAVPQLVFTIVVVFVIDLLFKRDEPIASKEYFKDELTKLGNMTSMEKKVSIISLFLVFGVATTKFHGMSLGAIFVFAATIMLLPALNLATLKDLGEVNFGFVIFVAACLCIGIVSGELGVGQLIADLIYPMISGSPTQIFAGTWLMGFLINFILTPLAAFSAFTIPVIGFAVDFGLNAVALLYTFLLSIEHLLLPYEYAPVLLGFGFGLISLKNFCKFMAIRAIVGFIAIFVLYIPWWKLVGLV